mgnify:CR=1 FL=1
MSSKERKKPDLNLNSLYSDNTHDETNSLKLKINMYQNLFKSPDELTHLSQADRFNQEYVFRKFLFFATTIIVIVTSLFSIDLLPSVLLGCGVIGFNYFWTTLLVRKLLAEKKLRVVDLIFSVAKFGVSIIILFVAIQYLNLSPTGLLIGLLNIVLATIIYSFFRVLRFYKIKA